MRHKYVSRFNGEKIKKLFQNFSCIILTGARQVGKTTLLKHLFPDVPMFTFDPIHDIQNARKDPELFLNNNPPPIILDEIQYAPELVPILKRRIDKAGKNGLYILTGSQQWSILKNISESLAGRAILTHLEGFCLAEIAENQTKATWLEQWLSDPESFRHKKCTRLKLPRNLFEQLWRGSLPEAQFIDLEFITDFEFSYQSTYIEKDIRVLADVADLQLFGRFVKLLAAYIAQEINYSHIGRDIDITPQTVKRWISLLAQTFEWFEIPAYSNNSVKRISDRPKGYFSDTGQVCFSQMISSKEAIVSHPLFGSLFENAVVAEIRRLCFLMSTPPALYHWRVHSGPECDLILERDGKFYPIEIKAKSNPSKEDAKGLAAFRREHPHLNVQNGLIIAPSESLYAVTENDFVIPWDTDKISD